MRMITFRRLVKFAQEYPDAGKQLRLIKKDLKVNDFKNVNEVKDYFPYVSIVKDSRVVFNIHGNKYRLVLKFNFDAEIAYVRFIGTHKEYNKIDVNTI